VEGARGGPARRVGRLNRPAAELAGRPAGVLLDMDGTLVDSHAAVERAWISWATENGLDPDAVLAVAHGSPGEVTIRRLLPDLDDRAVARSVARQLEKEYDDLSDVVAAPGADALLAALDRLELPWAVVTSADVRLARARLGAAGIPDPPLLVTVEDVRVGKPDPEGYLLAARRLGVDPVRCLVVEDAAPGVEAGRAAGSVVVGLRGVPADMAVADLGELVDLLLRGGGAAGPTGGPPAG
jgi:HAD superfamily hydrolase (TIGR01509 family)